MTDKKPPRAKKAPLIEMGAVVWLKSGSPRMTITRLFTAPAQEDLGLPTRQMAEASFFRTDELRFVEYPVACLTTVRP
jgi:hypothetical protein